MSLISTMLGGAASLASSFISSVGGVLATTIGRIAPMLGGAEGWRMVGNVVSLVARIFDVFRGAESVEEMGDRALQGAEAGIRPEHFEDWDAYVARIRDLELRPELSARFSIEEKNAAGLGVAVRGLEEKFDVPSGAMAGLPLLVAANPGYFDAGRLESILRVTKDIKAIVDYVDGKLGRADREYVLDTLTQAGRAFQPAQPAEQVRADLAAALERAAERQRP